MRLEIGGLRFEIGDWRFEIFLDFLEEAKEEFVNTVDDSRQVGFPVQEIKIIDLHGEHLARVVLIDELIVEPIEILQVVQLHLLLVVASSFLDVFHQMRDGGLQIYHEVGHAHDSHHRFKQFHIAIEITVIKVAHRMIVDGEDIDSLKNAPVLDDGFFRVGDVKQVPETLLKEINLQRERPSGDVLVIVLEIRIVFDRLKLGRPAIVLGKQMGERGLAASYISCNDDVHG